MNVCDPYLWENSSKFLVEGSEEVLDENQLRLDAYYHAKRLLQASCGLQLAIQDILNSALKDINSAVLKRKKALQFFRKQCKTLQEENSSSFIRVDKDNLPRLLYLAMQCPVDKVGISYQRKFPLALLAVKVKEEEKFRFENSKIMTARSYNELWLASSMLMQGMKENNFPMILSAIDAIKGNSDYVRQQEHVLQVVRSSYIPLLDKLILENS